MKWLGRIGFALSLLAVSALANAQTASLLPDGIQQYLDNNGKPLANGSVGYYVPSTTTPKTTWTSSSESVAQPNPIPLGISGRPASPIYGDGSYRQILKDQFGNVIWDYNTASAGSGSGTSPAFSEGVMVGTIISWTNPVLPAKYLYTAGQAISRTSYPDLYNALVIQTNILCTIGIASVSVSTTISDRTPIGAPIESSCFAPGTTVIAKSSGLLTLSNSATVSISTSAVLFPWGNGDGSTTFNVPDLRGRTPIGRNNMGGTASSTLLSTYYVNGTTPVNPNAMGAVAGNQSHAMIAAEVPNLNSVGLNSITVSTPKSFPVTSGNSDAITSQPTPSSGGNNVPYNSSGGTWTAISSLSTSQNITVSTQGTGGAPHSIMQPGVTVDYIIKALPDDLPTGPGVTSIQGMTGSIACAGTAITCSAQTITVNLPTTGVLSIGGMTGDIACGVGISCTAGTLTTSVPWIYATNYGVKCDGSTDDTAAAQAAITAAAGLPVVFPAGTCVISSTLSYTTTSSNVFTQGLQIYGQGREKTIFDSRVANNFLFATDTSVDSHFQSGIVFKGFKITSTAPAAVSSGIRIHKGAYFTIDNVQMTGLTGTGIYVPIAADPSSSFVGRINEVRMDSISAWCVDFLPDAGTELSNIRITNSTFQACGATQTVGAIPLTGGIRWRGILMQIENSGFTLNQNVDLYIAQNGTAQGLTIDGTDFENNISTLFPHIFSDTGLRQFIMTNSQCLNNDSFVSQGCAWFDSTLGPVGNVRISNHQIRATAGNNPYTAFKLTGANSLSTFIQVDNIYWQTFDTAGQSRFSGFVFPPIPGQAHLVIASTNNISLIPVGVGNSMPMRAGGGATGEWVAFHIPLTGITLATGSLTGNTTYYVYLYNSAAPLSNTPIVGALEVSTAAPTNTNSIEGYYVKTGDPSRLYVGMATTDSGGNFQIGGYLNSQYPPQSDVPYCVNVLTADVAMNNTANYFVGPSCAVPSLSNSTYKVSATVTVLDTVGAAAIICRLSDGTTIFGSSRTTTTGASNPASFSLIGVITNPASGLRVECRDSASTSGVIAFNNSGNSKDSQIVAEKLR